jgi:type IV pilus assembly protein PilA
MRCPKCRSENAPGAAFCAGCGLRLPIGATSQRKGMAIASLVVGLIGLPTFGILGIGAILAIVLGIVALVRSNKDPATYGGKGLAIGGIVSGVLSIVLIPAIGIVAAIAIPSLLRARISANEAAAIRDVQSVISAETAYSASNGGFFDKLDCLVTPQRCIPAYSANAPTFLQAEFTQESARAGYQRALHAGPAPVDPDLDRISPTSMTAFAYVAVPNVYGRTGVRAFCGDSTGIVCATAGEEMPSIVDGQCPSSDVCQRIY